MLKAGYICTRCRMMKWTNKNRACIVKRNVLISIKRQGLFQMNSMQKQMYGGIKYLKSEF